MLSQSLVAALATLVALSHGLPLPLNINLGAYSPALVVGDGAMSFEEGGEVENIVNSLQGAATSEGAAVASAATAPAPGEGTPAAGAQNAVVQEEVSSSPISEPATIATPETKKILEPRPRSEQDAEKRQVDEHQIAKRQAVSGGFDRALRYAEAALEKGPKVQLGTGEGGAGVGIIVDNNQQVASLPGKGA